MPHDVTADSVVSALAQGSPTVWLRPGLPGASVTLGATESVIDPDLMDDAEQRLQRFAPWFARTFPATAEQDGIIESPLIRAPRTRDYLNARMGVELEGDLWLKRDDLLPVSGSIKARGGFHEVLEFAETVARGAGLDHPDPATFGSGVFRDLASTYRIVVGSTGNLGLSIGILSASLGFTTTVHMSSDARGWKKELLRRQGVTVVEHDGDFVEAVEAGRASAAGAPRTHFVDDERSTSLFAGYSVAAVRVREQLAAAGVTVDDHHQLVVYLPCGIGGGPGGVTYGLKKVFGDNVHCVFVEPTEAPAMLLGVRTGLHGDIAVQDIGLSGRTAADGLAVSRPSRFVGSTVGDLIDGFATVSDDTIRAGVGVLYDQESIEVEPSATAALTVPWRAVGAAADVPWPQGPCTTHLVWLTGGAMVPGDERSTYITEGRRLLDSTPDVLGS
ncbi:D-serine ammonia-lyase [Corynebacterium pacaense]|uniref:D-serine ammonia-lyase n=1 Tax=Corynebacterium pacaense TaxID=1816684 RepID=UPI001C4E2A0B|nr:D-serine ammonia-lyase [Corynebacterium pacaense]